MKKRLVSILLSALTVASLTGCSITVSTDDVKDQTVATEGNATESNQIELNKDDNIVTDEETSASEEENTQNEVNSDVPTGCFIIDGNTFEVGKLTLSDLAGWEHEQLNESSLDAGYKSLSAIKCYNDAYGTGFKASSISVFIENDTNEAKAIENCTVTGVKLSAQAGNNMADKYPDTVVKGGITFGSSLDDVNAVFGQPYDTYTNDKYSTYSYEVENCSYKFTVLNNGGVSQIEIKAY